MPAQTQPIPPKLAARPSFGLFAAAILVFAAIAGGAVLFFFDPTKNNFYPICQFHALTGLYCPGCGATRAAYQLLHGNFLVALHDNALFVLGLAALAVRGLWFLKRRANHQPVRYFIPPVGLWVFLVVALVFVVLRNLPAFSFLAPIAAIR
ncbi:MAG TPA: DUF2752 domain-containing protein [Candidatus Acidoferrum sp.]|jgi:hypothetical protein|nr:DUF2752 domain-containing protein [Candidatus Acidoferrum sp.]